MDNDLISLNDGSKTRVNCAISGESAPDVILVHNSLVAGATWKQLEDRSISHCSVRWM
jgi:uncharacterized protein (DUF736 family)